MPSALPEGDPAPPDGALPQEALAGAVERPFGVYVHVPFCTVRCGYCDFNTYTVADLGTASGVPGASRTTYAAAAVAEVRLARRVLGTPRALVQTVFFGGGTPTLLSPADLASVLRAVEGELGLAPGAEVTTEANPDSVTKADLIALREAGFNRISFGMQSAVGHVLTVLERTHDPARVPDVVAWARAAGFEQISLDLIYGTPGESLADWETSLDAALACEPDHISAYSLIVEDGTALARRVRRGELPMPDEDDLADKYAAADARLAGAGLQWYEVSNWARDDDARCRHNLLYWTGADWWGVGPGAHSHLGGVRWWNVRHPAAYADR
ncbi:MAG TPA: radical SAM family heme chaperone HemW, partial [Nocardioides sp.]|nr:radical SAM family heme chaperone HemW [Nocardioides sp.]